MEFIDRVIVVLCTMTVVLGGLFLLLITIGPAVMFLIGAFIFAFFMFWEAMK